MLYREIVLYAYVRGWKDKPIGIHDGRLRTCLMFSENYLIQLNDYIWFDQMSAPEILPLSKILS